MDTEEYMRHRHLPHEMKERVRKHNLYKWIKFRNVEEEEIMHALPLDVRRDIKHHICIELVRRVSYNFFFIYDFVPFLNSK